MTEQNGKYFPFYDAIKSMLKEGPGGLHPKIGFHGAIQGIPLTKWSESMQGIDAEEDKLKREGKLTQGAAEELLKRGLPIQVRDSLLAPSARDRSAPSFECYAPDLPQNFLNAMDYLDGENADEDIRGKAVQAMIAYCLHCYLAAFLSRNADAVQALHWPGNPDLKLTVKQRLALGLVRECVIFEHFKSLAAFWEVFQHICKNCFSFIHLFDVRDRFTKKRIDELLKGNSPALALFQVMEEMICEPTDLYSLVGTCDEYRFYPYHVTIDVPEEIRQLMEQNLME